MKLNNRKPLIMLGIVFMLGIMVGAMLVLAMLPGKSSVPGVGMASFMRLPALGFVGMLVVMGLFMRQVMAGRGSKSASGEEQQVSDAAHKDSTMTSLEYTIEAISCGHCKMRIEEAIGKMEGVQSVHVSVDTQQARVVFVLPARESEIEETLREIGYAPN